MGLEDLPIQSMPVEGWPFDFDVAEDMYLEYVNHNVLPTEYLAQPSWWWTFVRDYRRMENGVRTILERQKKAKNPPRT